MRKLIMIVLSMFLYIGVQAQEGTTNEDVWINRINMIETQECIDSVTCYTEVIIDVNPVVVPDSLFIKVTIGSSYGLSDIYLASYQNTPSIGDNENVEVIEGGVIKINMGKYIVTEAFFIDMGIE